VGPDWIIQDTISDGRGRSVNRTDSRPDFPRATGPVSDHINRWSYGTLTSCKMPAANTRQRPQAQPRTPYAVRTPTVRAKLTKRHARHGAAGH
jgi:hypothetical protein